MLKKAEELINETRQKMRGGNGSVKIEHFFSDEEMKSRVRLCCRLTLEPGDSIGFHEHPNEEEIFIILKGQASAVDMGKTVILNPGDALLTGDGSGHSIESIGSEPLELIAFIAQY